MAEPQPETFDELADRIEEAAARSLSLPPNDIHAVRAQNRAAQIEASIVSHIEERLEMMEHYTPVQRAAHRRQWAADIVTAALAIRDGANQ